MDDLSNMHGFHKVLGYKYAYVCFLSIIYDFKYACFVPPVNQETLPTRTSQISSEILKTKSVLISEFHSLHDHYPSPNTSLNELPVPTPLPKD